MTDVAPTLSGLIVRDLEDGVEVTRETRENAIELAVTFGERDDDMQLDTGIDFFNHMLEMVAWYAGFNIRVVYRVKRFRLTHVVCEDVGTALGHAIRRVIEQRIPQGVSSVGEGHGAIDDALAFSMFVLEGRANHHVVIPESQRGPVEDAKGTDLVQFFDGFAQGSGGTLHLHLLSGVDQHHQWEASFRAFAQAVRAALAPDLWRANTTAGVKGTLA
jgi:imidazoleglycerol-phosphate dehydratase